MKSDSQIATSSLGHGAHGGVESDNEDDQDNNSDGKDGHDDEEHDKQSSERVGRLLALLEGLLGLLSTSLYLVAEGSKSGLQLSHAIQRGLGLLLDSFNIGRKCIHLLNLGLNSSNISRVLLLSLLEVRSLLGDLGLNLIVDIVSNGLDLGIQRLNEGHSVRRVGLQRGN